MEVLGPRHLNCKLLCVLHTWFMYLTSFTNLILTRFFVQFALQNACKCEKQIRIEKNKKQATAGKFFNVKVILIACKIFENSAFLPLMLSLSCHSVSRRPQKSQIFLELSVTNTSIQAFLRAANPSQECSPNRLPVTQSHNLIYRN